MLKYSSFSLPDIVMLTVSFDRINTTSVEKLDLYLHPIKTYALFSEKT